MILAIEIIVDAGYSRKLQSWLHTSARENGEHDMTAAVRLQLRRDLHEGTLEAIHRWDPRGTVQYGAFDFLAMCIGDPHRYIDIAALITRSLEKSRCRYAWRAAEWNRLLLAWNHKLLNHRGAIELQAAIFNLYHQESPSRWNFKNLLTDIQYDKRHPLRPENSRPLSEISIRMHRLATAYAELVSHRYDMGRKVKGLFSRTYAGTDAEEALRRVKDLYGDEISK